MRFIKGFFKFIGRTFVSVIMALIHLTIFIAKMEWTFVQKYIHMVNEYTGDGTLGVDGSAKETHWSVRYPIRAILWLFVPLVVFIVPLGLAGIIGGILIVIDQTTYPSFPVDDVFTTIDASKDGSTAKGNLMLTASYHQMEKELNSTLGWTPNDILGGQFWDNRVNRQLGVRHGSIELVAVVGEADPADPEVVEHVVEDEGGLALIDRLLVVPDLQLALEVDEPGADPDVDPVDPRGGDVEQVAGDAGA